MEREMNEPENRKRRKPKQEATTISARHQYGPIIETTKAI